MMPDYNQFPHTAECQDFRRRWMASRLDNMAIGAADPGDESTVCLDSCKALHRTEHDRMIERYGDEQVIEGFGLVRKLSDDSLAPRISLGEAAQQPDGGYLIFHGDTQKIAGLLRRALRALEASRFL